MNKDLVRAPVERQGMLPCPFCGIEPTLYKPGPSTWTVLHQCKSIKAVIKPTTKKDAIKAWNERAA